MIPDPHEGACLRCGLPTQAFARLGRAGVRLVGRTGRKKGLWRRKRGYLFYCTFQILIPFRGGRSQEEEYEESFEEHPYGYQELYADDPEPYYPEDTYDTNTDCDDYRREVTDDERW